MQWHVNAVQQGDLSREGRYNWSRAGGVLIIYNDIVLEAGTWEIVREAGLIDTGAIAGVHSTDAIDETNQVVTVDDDETKGMEWSPSGLADSGG